MTLRKVAIAVFTFGAVAFSVAVFLNVSRSQAAHNPAFVAATTALTDDSFAELVSASEKPIVADFYGDYCTVCRQLEPQLADLIADYRESAVFARVNVQEAPQLVAQYKVQMVPTLVVIHRGEVLFHGAGMKALEPMQAVLASACAPKKSSPVSKATTNTPTAAAALGPENAATQLSLR